MMKQDKEIIGYKLIKQEYEKAAIAIVDSSVGLWNDRINFSPNDTWYNKFKNAGVLDIWFTPVYKEEPKFEVGKWYKITAFSNNVVYFIKYLKSENEAIFVSDFITCFGNFGLFGQFTNVNILKSECVLQEIQPFLPDGHPDKIVKEFVLPEKWYIECNEENRTTLNTYFHTIGNSYIGYSSDRWSVVVSYCYMYPQLTPKSWGTQRKDLADYTEITFEQFKKYVLKEDTNYKIGDYVIADCKTVKGYLVKLTNVTNMEGYYKTPSGISNRDIKLSKHTAGFTNIQRKALPNEIPTDEVDWSKATKEEILAEAKRRYPEGTKHRGANTTGLKSTLEFIVKGELYWSNDSYIYCRDYIGAIYVKQNIGTEWAEIIKSPKEVPYTPGMRTPDIGPYYGKTELFSKEQLEVINKMIDDKVKELQ